MSETDSAVKQHPSPASRNSPEAIEDIFSYHSPEPDQIPCYEAIRAAAKAFALILIANTPPSPDQSTALRKLRECTMTANASIALKGKY